jgi:hypothetical protein
MSKYLTKGVMRKPKAFRYQSLIQSVLIENITVATKDEIELAHKFIIVNNLKLEELIMEMKQLKEFAKEVGVKTTEANKMDEETLIAEIITRVEPQNEYSKELVAFYNSLDDSYFDEKDATNGVQKTDDSGEGGYPIEEVIEAIKEYTKVKDLKELLADDDVSSLFKGFDPSPYKLAPKLKKAMIEFLENPPEEETEEETESYGENAEIISAIEELNSEEDLVAVFEELQESHFSDVDLESIETADQLKEAMLAALTPKEPEPEKKKTSLLNKLKKGKTAKSDDEWSWFDPEGDPEEMYAQVEEIKGIAKLKGFAKQKMGLSFKVGTKKDEILDAIANQLQEGIEGGVSESTEEAEAELTLDMVKDAVKAKDKELLAEMCAQLDIKLNALQKKSINGMKSKLEAALSDSKPKEKKKATQKKLNLKGKTTKPSESQSVYQIMEEMVLEGKSETAIVKAVSPFYKDKGKSILFIKKRVQIMTPIIKMDNDLE